VSLGSSFAVRFEPKKNSGLNITFNEVGARPAASRSRRSEISSRAAEGPRRAEERLRDARLARRVRDLVDYVVLRIAKPDTLVVYDAQNTSSPSRIDTIKLAPNAAAASAPSRRRRRRTSPAASRSNDLDETTNVIDVESATDGKRNVVARSSGTAKLVATGGTFVQEVAVEVSP